MAKFRTKIIIDIKSGSVIFHKTYEGKELELLEKREERKKKIEKLEYKWYRWSNIKKSFYL